MPQLDTIVLNDRATTPVAHTFNPRGIDGGVASLVESTGVPLGDRKVTVSSTRTSNGRVKVVMKIAVPVVQATTLSGVTSYALLRTAYAETTFSFDSGSSAQERADICEFVAGLCASDADLIPAVIEDLEGLW